ncbi:MAG TPA: hypothetical protein VK326_07920 [Solirubrobacterales bacterium]|nr:hypothetical protein [Solirubrobacterales bacterium]
MGTRSLSRAVLAAALVALAAGPASAGAAGRPEPPSVGAVKRATDRFLEQRGGERSRAAPPAARGPAPGPLLPGSRVVSLYGSPQMPATAVGMRSPEAALRKLTSQARPYDQLGVRPVVLELDLASVLATAGPGADRKYRVRQDPEIISEYLSAARAAGARLMLDIQPGRSTFKSEVRALRDWVAQPDVDVALDPEWNVGRRGVPGRTEGAVGARELNRVIRILSATVRDGDLPPKLLVVHQFRPASVRGRARVRPRFGVQPLLNFDGIGSPRAKANGYVALGTPRLFNGFSLFYQRDDPLMQPSAVLALEPEPDFLLYQ